MRLLSTFVFAGAVILAAQCGSGYAADIHYNQQDMMKELRTEALDTNDANVRDCMRTTANVGVKSNQLTKRDDVIAYMLKICASGDGITLEMSSRQMFGMPMSREEIVAKRALWAQEILQEQFPDETAAVGEASDDDAVVVETRSCIDGWEKSLLAAGHTDRDDIAPESARLCDDDAINLIERNSPRPHATRLLKLQRPPGRPMLHTPIARSMR